MKKLLKIKSSTLTILITLYFGFILNISFWNLVIETIEIQNASIAIFSFSLIFFILVPLFLFFNLITFPIISKPFIVLLLLISGYTNYMMTFYGIYIDWKMIQNVFETNTREALDLITISLIMWLFVTAIIPSLYVIFCKIEYKSLFKELKFKAISSFFALLIVGIFALTSYKEYAAFGRNNRQATSLMNVVNYISGTISYTKRVIRSKQKFIILDDNPKMQHHDKDKPSVFVLMLGETARSSNFSLNGYERETNPLLKKQDLVNFKDTSSCGTATAISVPCMFSNMTRSNFKSSLARRSENLLDLLQKAGYEVIWKDNNDGCKGVCNRVEKIEFMINSNNPKYCDGRYCYDGILLEELEEIMRNITKDTVIILNVMGSHGPTYYKRYPEKFKKFTPTCDTADIQKCTQEEIINTYDNTILYTDYTTSQAIDILKQYPKYETSLIYLSDHGESLGENNIYLHGMPYAIAPTAQTSVPMFLWLSDTAKKDINYKCMKEFAKKGKFSHDNVFHSVISLVKLQTSVYDKNLDVFAKCMRK